jgi:hypothetical protein
VWICVVAKISKISKISLLANISVADDRFICQENDQCKTKGKSERNYKLAL